MSRVDILGVGFDALTGEEAVARALELMGERRAAYVCTPNPEIVLMAREDPSLMDAVNGADLVLPDGVGVVWASRKLGTPVPERVAGYDFLLALLGCMEGSVYILGGRAGVAELAAERIRTTFPGVTIAGTCDGFIRDELALIAEIGEREPDLMMVCLGAGKQELWMAAHRDLPVGIMAGLGGSVDVLAGTVPRAPDWWRGHGLEWLYRLIKQPSRLKRQLRLPGYILLVFRQKRIQARKTVRN